MLYNKNKLYKTLDYWSRDVLSFNFPEKSLGLVSPPHFVYDFSRTMFLMLHSFNWPNFIVLLFHEMPLKLWNCISWNALKETFHNLSLPWVIKRLDTSCSPGKLETIDKTLLKVYREVLDIVKNKLSQTWECTFKY